MKRNVYTLAILAASAVLSFTSCTPKSTTPQTVDGLVMDASMNNIMLITTAGDTIDISTMDADPAKVPGVLVDDSVQVTYADTTISGQVVKRALALTVTAHSPYYYIQGMWVEPNPIDPASVQGVKLNQDGTAESINMATLVFKNWNLVAPGTLILNVESMGNGQTIAAADTMTIDKLDADSLVLADRAGNVVWRLGRQK